MSRPAEPYPAGAPAEGTEEWYKGALLAGLSEMHSIAQRHIHEIEWDRGRRRGRAKRSKGLSVADRELIAALQRTLVSLEAYRTALDDGRIWEAQYHLSTVAPTAVIVREIRGSRTEQGARRGGESRSRTDRDAEWLAMFERRLAASNTKRPAVIRAQLSRDLGVKSETLRKALSRASKARKK